jgi:hypothetical protein
MVSQVEILFRLISWEALEYIRCHKRPKFLYPIPVTHCLSAALVTWLLSVKRNSLEKAATMSHSQKLRYGRSHLGRKLGLDTKSIYFR